MTHRPIHSAVYSSIPVYEMNVKDVAVMRRVSDSFMNATQILKVAGFSKPRRTKILEKEVLADPQHEKIQGGYGKYQGTWIPLDSGRELARRYGVENLVSPLLDFDPNRDQVQPKKVAGGPAAAKPAWVQPASVGGEPATPAYQPAATLTSGYYSYPAGPSSSFSNVLPRSLASSRSNSPDRTSLHDSIPSSGRPSPDRRTLGQDGSGDCALNSSNGMLGASMGATRFGELALSDSPDGHPRTKRQKRAEPDPDDELFEPLAMSTSSIPQPLVPRRARKENMGLGDRQREVLVEIFLEESPENNKRILDLLTFEEATGHATHAFGMGGMTSHFTHKRDLKVDLILDQEGNSALHWAAALARSRTIRMLLKSGAKPSTLNLAGQTPLMRAVMCAHNFEQQTFWRLLCQLKEVVHVADNEGRTVLHHIAATGATLGERNRTLIAAAKYYARCIARWWEKNKSMGAGFVDFQDRNGDTGLLLAARSGNKNLVEVFIKMGADPEVENKQGVKAIQYGAMDPQLSRLLKREDTGASDAESDADEDLIPIHTHIANSLGLNTNFSDEMESLADQTDGDKIMNTVRKLFRSAQQKFFAEQREKDQRLQALETSCKQAMDQLAEARLQLAELAAAGAEDGGQATDAIADTFPDMMTFSSMPTSNMTVAGVTEVQRKLEEVQTALADTIEQGKVSASAAAFAAWTGGKELPELPAFDFEAVRNM